MFNWLLNNTPTKKIEINVFDLSKQSAAEITNAFAQFIRRSYGHVHDTYLNALRARLQPDIKRTDFPPLMVARFDIESFIENVSVLRMEMLSETNSNLSYWLDLADKAGGRSEVDKFFRQEILKVSDKLLSSGLNIFSEYATILNDADAAWRIAYPELAKNFPDSFQKNS